MNNTIIYLIGHPGVGKLTIAKAICAASGARLLDNHLVNNVVFSLIRTDGKTPMPDAIWDAIAGIRDIAFGVIESLAPPEFSYVLTNALRDDPFDRQWFNRVLLLAARRDARFLPVQLNCEEAEHARRVDTPARAANLKHTDVAAVLHRRRTVPVLTIDHPNLLAIDTTRLPPDEAAAEIIAAAERLSA